MYGVNRQQRRDSHHDDISSFVIVDGDVNTNVNMSRLTQSSCRNVRYHFNFMQIAFYSMRRVSKYFQFYLANYLHTAPCFCCAFTFSICRNCPRNQINVEWMSNFKWNIMWSKIIMKFVDTKFTLSCRLWFRMCGEIHSIKRTKGQQWWDQWWHVLCCKAFHISSFFCFCGRKCIEKKKKMSVCVSCVSCVSRYYSCRWQTRQCTLQGTKCDWSE